MLRTNGRALLAAALGLAAFHASPASAADLTLDAASGFAVPVEVRGQTLRLRVDLEAPGHPILNPGAAARVGFRGSLVRARAVIGPVRLRGRTNGSKFRIAGAERDHRFVWFDRDLLGDADGIISPEDLPYDNVIFRLRPSVPGEVTTVVTLDFKRGSGLFLPLAIAGRTVSVQFSTLQPLSLATASAGAHLAASLGGAWDGEQREAPIEFGVSRPVRPILLANPLAIDTFGLSRFFVRTRDHRGNFQLPADASDDPDEILVTGGSRQRARLAFTVGLDRLSACSTIAYQRATRRLTLNCAPAAGPPLS